MTIQKIADKVTKENKVKIIEAIKQNNISIKQNGKYNSNGLQLLFNEWHRHFPNIKQQLSCIGCRKAVTLFWENVNKHWNLQE
tara:strand:- start:644 stop:892 length:249 start_codon:yes stop_codon:yes gene_type:complete